MIEEEMPDTDAQGTLKYSYLRYKKERPLHWANAALELQLLDPVATFIICKSNVTFVTFSYFTVCLFLSS